MSDLLVGNQLRYSICTHKLVNNILQQGYTYDNSIAIPDRHFYSDSYSNSVSKDVYD